MKDWTQSSVMVKALLVMIAGVLSAIIPFLKILNVNLEWLETISGWLTPENINMIMGWLGGIIGFITTILGIKIWIARKKSQGEKIAPRKTLTRNYTKR